MTKYKRVLVYGYGNPGRQDDGLGAAFISKMETWIVNNPGIRINLDCNYQLNIEDAEVISEMDLVIFVDASQEEIEGFTFTRVDASSAKVEFSMHAVSPAFVLDLCKKMFHDAPVTYLLHIKGISWDFKEELTKTAEENLEKAFAFLTNEILKGDLLAIETN